MSTSPGPDLSRNDFKLQIHHIWDSEMLTQVQAREAWGFLWEHLWVGPGPEACMLAMDF